MLHVRELRPTRSDGNLGAKPVREPKPPNSDVHLGAKPVREPKSPNADVNLGSKPAREPEPPNLDVNLGSKPMRQPKTPNSDVEPCTVTQIPLIPAPFHVVQHRHRRLQGLRGGIELPRQRHAGHQKTSPV